MQESYLDSKLIVKLEQK